MGTKATLEGKNFWFMAKFKEARKTGRFLNKKRLVAEFCLSMSASRRIAMEILKNCEDFGTIALHKDRIEVLK